MIKPKASSHWYDKYGTPSYGSTLREARKFDLYPSVTSIIGILEKPAITAWKVNTMLDCAWNVSKDSCDVDTWKSIVEDQWSEETKRAADVGTAIHDYAQSYIEGGTTPSGNRVNGYEKQCELLEKWIDDNIDSCTCETSFSWTEYDQGYGGRIDCHGYLKDGRPFVLDFKTQNLKGKDKPNWYDEWKWQLAAYKKYLDDVSFTSKHVAISVVIDTGNIDMIYSREYDEEEMHKGFSKFVALLDTFYVLKEL